MPVIALKHFWHTTSYDSNRPSFHRYRRLSMKRILATAIVVASIAVTTGCDNAEKRQEKYIAQGETYSAEGNLEKARISFKNALQINPENITAKLKFGEVLERQGEYREAYGMYSSVLEKDANNLVALELQGKILLMAREFDKAQKNAEKLVSLKGKDYVPAVLLQAGVLAITDKVVEATTQAERASTLDSANLEASVLLSGLYLRQGDLSAAEKKLREAIVVHPDVNGLKTMLTETLKRQGKTDEVEAVLRDLVKSDRDNLTYVMQLSKLQLDQQKKEAAVDTLESFVKSHDDNSQAKMALVQLLALTQSEQAADARMEAFIAANPQEYALQFFQIDSWIARKKKDLAVTKLEQIASAEKISVNGDKARVALARIKAADKDYDAAKNLIAEVLATNAADLDALALRGAIALQEKRYIDAIGDLRAVTKERADDIRSTMLLVSAHLANNESDLAVELLHKVVAMRPELIKAKVMLAQLLDKKGNIDGAVHQYQDVLARKPEEVNAMLALAKIYQRSRKADELAKVADQLLGQKDGMAGGFYYQGWLKLVEGKHEQARELFDKALSLAPAAVEPTTSKVQSYLAQNRWQESVKWLNARLVAQPKNSTLFNLLAESYLAGKDVKNARAALQRSIDANPEWWIPYRSLASIELSQKNDEEARNILERGIKATKHPLLRMQLAGLLERTGDADGSIQIYRQMIDEGIKEDAVINNLAMLLITHKTDQASLDSARGYGDKLAASDNPLYLDTAGWVHYMRGDYQSALPILKKAVELAPGQALIRYHLGVAYFKNNQLQEARENLLLSLKTDEKFDGRSEAEQVLQKIQKS